jgi:hypothetical protein
MLADLMAEAPQSRLGDPEKRYAENIREVVHDIQALVGEAADPAAGEVLRDLRARLFAWMRRNEDPALSWPSMR